jgi:rhamnose transport system ATP-binding protein
MLDAPTTRISARSLSGSNEPLLTLSGISKSFPGVRALSRVSLDLYPGEVTALVGENGAGKSTLVKILTGIYQPDEGMIAIGGEAITFASASDAARAGVTAIHQETVLFDELSVAENIFLGHAPRGRFGLIDWAAMNAQASTLLERIGARIAPETRLRDLGIASRHLVAIARALSVEARIVIMDEPTASLSHKEIAELYELIERLKAEGKAILFISHKFDEIFRIADRYVALRDGERVGAGLIADTDHNELVRLMVGRTVDQIFPKSVHAIGETVLAVAGYSHPTEFEDISFELRRGEILGFYGLIGAGRSELMKALFGITKPSAGELTIEGDTVTIRNPTDAIGHGIVYVPEERGRQGAIAGLPIFQNITLPSLPETSRAGFLQLAEEFKLARDYAQRLEVRAASLDRDIGTLSGGNQQKVVIAKWLATEPKIIILDEPTKGIDIGSKAAVHGFMNELASRGLSIIMVSSEIPEILGMSDRVIVMREGRMAGVFAREGLDAETLVRAAAGIREVH